MRSERANSFYSHCFCILEVQSQLIKTPTKLYTLFRIERYVKNHTFYQCLSHGKIGLEAVFNDFLDRSINDVYHIWSPLLEFCKDINPCFW